MAAGIGIVNPGAWRGLARTSRVEVAIAAITMAGVILVLVLEALLEAGIVELVGGDHLYPTVRAAVQAAAAPAPGSPSEGGGRPPSETGR